MGEPDDVDTFFIDIDAAAAIRNLLAAGWTQTRQLGVRVTNGLTHPVPDERRLRDEIERLRANGIPPADLTEVHATQLTAPWRPPDEPLAGPPARQPVARPTPRPAPPRERRFVKEVSTGPLGNPTPARKGAGSSRAQPASSTQQAALVSEQLFADPEDQLRYEVRHYYLHTVPVSQRSQWPLEDYLILPSFMEDLGSPDIRNSTGKARLISAITDVVCGRVYDVNSRKTHPLASSTSLKSAGNPPVTRSSDGAVAMRAAVQTGTPAARRIMWWRTPGRGVELARIATHDDMKMPEQ